MKRVKEAKWAYIILSALFIVLGVVIILYPDISALSLCCIIGVTTLLFGIMKLVCFFAKDAYGLAFQFDLALGIFLSVIGVLLLIHPYDVIKLLPVIIGIFILIDGVFKFQTSIDAKDFGFREWWVILLLGIITGIMGILLIINPFEGAYVLMTFLGISLIVDGLQNLYTAIFTIKLVKSALNSNDFGRDFR